MKFDTFSMKSNKFFENKFAFYSANKTFRRKDRKKKILFFFFTNRIEDCDKNKSKCLGWCVQ